MEQKSFADIFEDVTKRAVKIQKKDYLPTGRYPIIDQGQEWCAGYTDREDGLFQDVPAYIFGDHTRIIKYTDEPFYLGADGVKLLKLREGIQANPRFFYYALKSQRIPDTGYNRHFKWLKESLYHVPTLNEQTHIVDTLDTLSTLITLCKTKIFLFDELVKSRFVEMFGDPVTNPMGWETVKIADALIVEPQNGLYKPQSDYVHDKSGIPILRIDGFYEGKVSNWLVLKRLKCTKEEIQKYLLHEGDIVINRVNSIEHLGKCAHISNLHEPTVYESNMMRMHFDPTRFNPVYITRLLCTQYIYNQIINHSKKAVNQASINQKDVMDFNIYHPPLDLQNEFAAFVEQADKSKLVLRQLLEKQQTLKAALMQEYFAVH